MNFKQQNLLKIKYTNKNSNCMQNELNINILLLKKKIFWVLYFVKNKLFLKLFKDPHFLLSYIFFLLFSFMILVFGLFYVWKQNVSPYITKQKKTWHPCNHHRSKKQPTAWFRPLAVTSRFDYYKCIGWFGTSDSYCRIT